jgi:hypothetical protein
MLIRIVFTGWPLPARSMVQLAASVSSVKFLMTIGKSRGRGCKPLKYHRDLEQGCVSTLSSTLVSVPGHALRCGPETSVTAPCVAVLKDRTRRRSSGNVGIPQGFPRGVGSVGSRLYGFPCFPLLVISTAWGCASLSVTFGEIGSGDS